LAWYEQGADFADALHVASCDQADEIFTFDRTLSNKIGSLAGVKIQLLN
jgi:predicted nucleic acid-binding protein